MNKKIILYFAFLLVSCSSKSNLNVNQISSEFCECFNDQTADDMDTKMTLCMDKLGNSRVEEVKSFYSSNNAEEALSRFTSEILNNMVRTCNSFGKETELMYDNTYSLDTTAANKREIANLSRKIREASNQDSLKSLLHLRLARYIKLRNFDNAFVDIESIQSIDTKDEGSYLAASHIYNKQGKHDLALKQIEKAMKILGRRDYQFFAEITKRKKNQQLTRCISHALTQLFTKYCYYPGLLSVNFSLLPALSSFRSISSNTVI